MCPLSNPSFIQVWPNMYPWLKINSVMQLYLHYPSHLHIEDCPSVNLSQNTPDFLFSEWVKGHQDGDSNPRMIARSSWLHWLIILWTCPIWSWQAHAYKIWLPSSPKYWPRNWDQNFGRLGDWNTKWHSFILAWTVGGQIADETDLDCWPRSIL